MQTLGMFRKILRSEYLQVRVQAGSLVFRTEPLASEHIQGLTMAYIDADEAARFSARASCKGWSRRRLHDCQKGA